MKLFMLMKRRLGLLFLLAVLGPNLLGQQRVTPPAPPVPQSTQQKPDDADVVKITTNLVQVDAVVTDKNGKLVTDLRPEEVEILEDDRKQKISHFSYNTTVTAGQPERTANDTPVDKNAPPIPPSKLKPEDVRRTIAVVVDDLGLSFESTAYVRRALKKFVDEQIQPGDLVAIIRTGGGMGALQQFTSDKRQLYAAVERVKWNSIGRGGASPFAPMDPPTPGPKGPEVDAAREELDRFREDVFAVGTLGAISYVVRGLNELPGRKSILLVSEGFRIFGSDVLGKNYTGKTQSKEYMAMDRLRRLIDQANRASVVIYTMNAMGLQYFGVRAADNTSGRTAGEVDDDVNARRNAAWETQSGLDYLAHETGGISIRNTNDLTGGIKRVLDDQRGYYLIGYRPDNATFDPRTGRRTFHKLSLKITRPGKFNVRMRNGFYGVTDAERAEPRTLGQEMVAALVSPFGATGVHLQLTSLFANDVKAGSYMRSVLHVDTRDLTFTDEPNNVHQCVFDVVAITFGDNGAVVDQPVGRTYTLALPDEVYKRATRDGLVYYLTVPIKKAGAYQLRISLRDTATKRIGSASQFIDVPDLKKNRLALSGLVLKGSSARRTPGKSLSANASDANTVSNPNQTDEGVDQGNADASPAVRHFKGGMFLDYGFVIYNAQVEKTSNQPRLMTQVRLFRGSTVVFSGNEIPYNVNNQIDLKRLIAGGQLQLGTDLVPGEYALQVIVTDLNADEKHRTVSQWMDFEIVK
jgi:VWFA-related protein